MKRDEAAQHSARLWEWKSTPEVASNFAASHAAAARALVRLRGRYCVKRSQAHAQTPHRARAQTPRRGAVEQWKKQICIYPRSWHHNCMYVCVCCVRVTCTAPALLFENCRQLARSFIFSFKLWLQPCAEVVSAPSLVSTYACQE